MKNFCSGLLVICSLLSYQNSIAQANDTIVVQAFSYNTTNDSTIVFPSDTIRFEKILMRYKLRCPYTVQCGEWDYLTYTYAYVPTGTYDSVMHLAPSYVVDGISPDSFAYSNTPTYLYHTHFDKYIVYDTIVSFNSATIGSGATTSSSPFAAGHSAGRSQYIWKASELIAGGLQAGPLSGMRFYFTNLSGETKNLSIKIKHSALDSITPGSYEKTGFTTVYQSNTIFSAPGWQSLAFTNSFTWDGISDIVVDISFTNSATTNTLDVNSDDAGFPAGITNESDDRSLFFNGADYLEVPVNGFANIDSAITISFWAYGNPPFQPQNQSVFEGVDSSGNRVLNCHLPWGDSNIYWDAGNIGTSYDRINKVATASQFEGQWNHWTFTKNTVTGRMNIYLNGALFSLGTSRTKLMSGITKFKIGSNAKGQWNYDGNIDDFTIWNTELDQPTISQWMLRDIDATHPQYSHLLYYYKFNDNSYTTAADSSTNNYTAALSGIPQSVIDSGATLNTNFTGTVYRPQVVFEQGTYIFHIDSTLVIDSTVSGPLNITAFNNPAQPLTPTDTFLVFPLTYSYTYDSTGTATDSVLANADSMLYLVNTPYYDPPFEKLIRYEIGRFITPYGNGLNLGNGFTWWYDVSDYRTVLHDSLRISSGNWQELLDLQFLFIKGVPPRDPIAVNNVWNGDYYLRAGDSVETKGLYPKQVLMNPLASTYKFKIRPTGHGEDNNNCAEFCMNTHSLKVNGTTQFNRMVWKDDCGLNPLYPQGGTWIYQRANWCPGDDVPTFDFELTPFVNPGDSTWLDYDVQPYISVGGSAANYVIESQVISYGPINHSLDAAVDVIKSPSTEDIFKRMNPICDNPVITIKNNGSSPLTSATVLFGFEGGTMNTYLWNGNLSFEQSEDVTLPGLVWNGTGNRFLAVVTNPNGGTDEYHHNDSMYSYFTIPQSLPNYLVFEFKTNSQPIQNSYVVKDAAGNIIHSRQNLLANTVYLDTLNLTNGCYTFRLLDTLESSGYGEDGLAWWANTAQGSGYMHIKNAASGALLKNFPTDFGREIYYQFTAVAGLNVDEQTDISAINIYPNPANDYVNLTMNFNHSNNVLVSIYDATGKKIYMQNFEHIVEKRLQLDIRDKAPGVYYAIIRTDKGVANKKFVIER